MARAKFEQQESTETRYDPLTIGGGKQVVHHDAGHTDGDGTIVGGSSAEGWDETNRYRGLGEAAAKRQAYQADFGKAMGDEQRGLDARGQQEAGLNNMRKAAMGGAPSQAAILGGQVGGQSLQAAMQSAAGARGLGAAAAQAQAAQAQQGAQLAGLGQFAGMRGNEMAHAQASYGTGANQMRGGDYAQQGMAQQRAEAQAQSENAQRALNQGAQLGYEQMGINNQQAQSDADLRRDQMQNQANADAQAAHDARNARYQNLFVAGSSAMATGGASLAGGGGKTIADNSGTAGPPPTTGSDERMKSNAHPLTMLSDNHTKLVAAQREAFTAGLSHANQAADTGTIGEPPEYMRDKPSTEKHQPPSLARAAASTTVAKKDDAYQRGVVRQGSSDLARAAIMSNPVMPISVQLGSDLMRDDVAGRSQAMAQRAQAPASLAPMPPAASYSDERTKKDSHAENDMGLALEQGYKPFEYEYRPGFREAEGQKPGEKNVGPMAQNMAGNSITGSAVEQGDDGLLRISIPKTVKTNSAGIGYLAARVRELDERTKGGR